MLGEINDDMRRVYSIYVGSQGIAAIAIRDLLAAKLKAEWEKQHYPVVQFCCGPQTARPGDPRHNYDDSAWQAEAERLLKGD